MSYNEYELKRLRSDLDIARSNLMDKDSKISQLESENYGNEQTIHTLETENSELRGKVSELEGKCEYCDHEALGYGHCDSCEERIPNEPTISEAYD